MSKFWGYARTWWNYCQSEKGRHDIVDYGRAAVLLAAIMVIVYVVAKWLFGE